MNCCNTLVIRPGGVGIYFFDFGNNENIFLDGLTLSGTPTITFSPDTTPPGGSDSPNFAPTLGVPSIVSPTTQPTAVGNIVVPQSGPVVPGPVVGVTISAGGSGWPNPPAKVWCTFTGGSGWGAVGIATVSQGEVVSVRMFSSGDGYTSSPTAVFHTAVISFLVTTSSIQDGFTYQLETYCNLSDGFQNVQGTGYLQVSW